MGFQIIVPADLQNKVEEQAKARGITVNDFVCESLERAVATTRADDSLFADSAVYSNNGSDDAATNHDDYLYEDAS